MGGRATHVVITTGKLDGRAFGEVDLAGGLKKKSCQSGLVRQVIADVAIPHQEIRGLGAGQFGQPREGVCLVVRVVPHAEADLSSGRVRQPESVDFARGNLEVCRAISRHWRLFPRRGPDRTRHPSPGR